MSWFNNLTSSINDAISDLATSAVKSYNSLTSYPTDIKCPNLQCSAINIVPASIFQWTCNCGLIHPIHLNSCPSCLGAKPYTPPPVIICYNCQFQINVPTSNFVKGVKTMINDAPENLQKGVSVVKSELSALGSLPTTFPCIHCSSVLATPTGPWVCQVNNCGAENTAGATNCINCSVYRYSLGVVCGVCGRSTSIPRNKFHADSNILAARASNSAVRNAAYATNKPYIECMYCAGVVHPPAAQVAQVLRIPSPTTVEGPDGTTTTGNELQLDLYEPSELPGAPANVTCGNCLRVLTYGAHDVHCYTLDSKRRTYAQAAAQQEQALGGSMPAAGPRPADNETECFSCKAALTSILSRKITCSRCGHLFCSNHAPYMRTINHNRTGLAGQGSFCIQCATEYDSEHSPATNATAPTINTASSEAPIAEVATAVPTAEVALPISENQNNGNEIASSSSNQDHYEITNNDDDEETM